MVRELLIERSEILEHFSREELDDILDDQMNGLFAEINGIPIDYYKPYYYKYKSLSEESMSNDAKEALENEFFAIAKTFIHKIETVFEFKINEEWLNDHYGDIPSIALLLYNYFVLELQQNIEDVVHRALKINTESLYKLFEDRKSKKDGSTTTYSKLSDPQLGLVLANIHDATVQLIEDMTAEEYVHYSPDGYIPGEFMMKLFDSGYIGEGFMDVIRKIFLGSTTLRSMICFNIEANYRSKE